MILESHAFIFLLLHAFPILILEQLPCYTLRLFGCIHRFLCPDVFNKRDTKGYDRKYKMRIKREPEKSRSTNGWTSNSLITCQDCKIVIIDDQTDEPKKSPTTHELPYDSLSSFSFSLSLSLHSLSIYYPSKHTSNEKRIVL